MKIALLVLPFHMPQFPSLGLTQIKGRLQEIFNNQVEVRLFYLNHDFYKLLGESQYLFIDGDSTYTCLNDWLFRNEAFDGVSDNQKEYLRRFYPGKQYMADMLKQLNMGALIQKLILENQLDSYDLVGINAAFSLTPGLAFCRHLKKMNPKIITVMGGATLHQEMGLALSQYYPYVDYVCSGSGLVSFPKLIRGLMNGSENECTSIPGMFSKKNFQQVEKLSENLDINIPIPLDFQDFLDSFRRLHGINPEIKPMIMLETSRGCYWNKCTFCGLSEDRQKYQVKSSDKAIEEINYYMGKFNCDLFMTDTVLPRGYFKNVLPYLRPPGEKGIVYEVRADYSEDEVKILKQAHIWKIQPGIESLVTPVHNLMNKGVNAFQCIYMLKLCIKYDLSPGWNLIFGFPGMIRDMYEQLLGIIPRVVHLQPPLTLTPVRFDRYCAYWKEPAKYNLQLEPFAAYKYIYPYDEKFLANIAYFFVDKNNFSPMVEMISRYYLDLKTAVDNWKNRWQPNKKVNKPQLYRCLKNNSPYIYDSRKDTVKEYGLSSLENDMLERLEHPQSIDLLKENPPGQMMEKDIGPILRGLEDRELVFKEGDRYMSLVIFDYPGNSV